MNIKNSIIIGFTVASLGSLSSCNLDYNPLDTYSDVTEGTIQQGGTKNPFKTKGDVESYMQSLYKIPKDRQEHWYLDLLLIGDAHSDNAYVGTTGAEVIPFEDNTLDAANSVISRDWSRYLTDIGKTNIMINYVDSVKDATLTEAERHSYKAQAEILRALVMFDLVRIFGNVPVNTTVPPDITSENIDSVYPQYFPKQSSPEVAYKQIESDLLDGLKYAPDNNTVDKTLFSKSVAKAMLAKIYAEKPLQDYDKVIQYADEVTADGFTLYPNYADLFAMNSDTTDTKVRNSSETILETQFFTGGGNWVTWMFGRNLLNWNENFTWAKWVTPSRDLIKAFEDEGDKVRENASIVYYSCGWSNYYPADHYPFMYKCRSGNSSIIKLRYSDILLLKAEALIMKSNPDLNTAADIIDKIRQRVGLNKLPASVRTNKDALLEAYLKERRLELAFEGQRWFDLVRLGKVESVMNNLNSRDSGRKQLAREYTEDSYILPIPQKVLDQNENLQQNKGY